LNEEVDKHSSNQSLRKSFAIKGEWKGKEIAEKGWGSMSSQKTWCLDIWRLE